MTWEEYCDDEDWVNEGGDFSPTPTSSLTLTDDTENTYVEFPVTADVQDFISNPETNFGWLIKDSTEPTWKRVDYSSSEDSHQSRWPELVVNYINFNISLLVCPLNKNFPKN